ncbi:glyoxalase [Ascobolus immersus RN42]|uniref:Lactoylglutathione lyase n=1 Tax=Ascobolus immersus RN42 TaxID=1160509 RepID=A0A3N4HM29_ASCIM|nr:glyoxalase [Ascobolus immersus RN42]
MADAKPFNTDTSKYLLNHTMIRVKNPTVTSEWYHKHFGMKLVHSMSFEDSKFALYFLGFDLPHYSDKHWTSRQGLLELTHNYGTENDDSFKVANGNEDPHRGFGHICISLPNLEETCAKLETAGVSWKKRLTEGRMKNIAFALDPDGYWVELVQSPPQLNAATDIPAALKYRLNHTMVRVKDIEKSLLFYTSTMGMSVLRKLENPDAKFDLYFLGYRPAYASTVEEGEEGVTGREGILELTYNYGSENDDSVVYHTGNTEPKGYGHVCVSVDDLDEAVKRFDDLGVKWQKRLEQGSMKDVAFLLDPDGYWIELIQNEELKRRAFW